MTPLFIAGNALLGGEHIAERIRQMGVVPGDTIFAHSDVGVFGKPIMLNREILLGGLVRALESAVGSEGTLVMPTFSYSFCKKEIFDPDKTPSTVGALTEYFRRLPGVHRSHHPIFSVAARGPRAAELCRVGMDSFDDDSIFGHLLRANAKIIFLGASFEACTFVHYAEQRRGVSYRYLKKFEGILRTPDGDRKTECTYNVRCLDRDVVTNLSRFASHLIERGLMRKAVAGGGTILVVMARNLLNEGMALLSKDPYAFLAYPPVAPPGAAMLEFIEKLFPICRSITGEGARATLNAVRKDIPIEIHEIPSGTKALDWVVPNEWNIRDAYVKNAQGEKIIDFKKNNLHIAGYSVPVCAKMPLAELQKHLYSLPNLPDAIPYVTSYYKEYWGFCLSNNERKRLPDGEYEVVIDSALAPGSLTYGELHLPGESADEMLISCYICHPAMCNDNLSGIALAAFLAKEIAAVPNRRFSYRFIFMPETIGSIVWLAKNEDRLHRIRWGLVATCCGDAGASTYKRSRRGNAEIDLIVETVLRDSGAPYSVIDFNPADGSDERQFCSPGFDLPVGSLMRTKYGVYPEYHTSLDNLSVMSRDGLADTLRKYREVVDVIEHNKTYRSLSPKGEPQLGRRGLFRLLGSLRDNISLDERTIFWALNFADGKHSLLDIAIRSGLKFSDIAAAVDPLIKAGLIEDIGTNSH